MAIIRTNKDRDIAPAGLALCALAVFVPALQAPARQGPLLLAGPRRIVVANRTQAKAEAVVQRHRQHPSLQQALARTDLRRSTPAEAPATTGTGACSLMSKDSWSGAWS